MPKVSIVINNYNYGRYVGHAIDSGLAQTYPDIEVIAVDDGSTDESRSVLESYGEKIKVLLQPNGGQTAALNAGLLASTGEWVCLLDSDDCFLPNKVERMLELAAQYPSAGMIAHDLQYCDEEGRPITFGKPYVARERLVDDRQLSRRGSLSVSLPATSGMCLRRDVLNQLLPMPDAMRLGTDNYMKWVALSLAPVLVSPELLAMQRIHDTNHGTKIVETGHREAWVRLAIDSALITYHMRRNHTHLRKLAWKQYGRLLYRLRSSRSMESKRVEDIIRRQYSVAESNPICLFYVTAAFIKAWVEDILRRGKQPAAA